MLIAGANGHAIETLGVLEQTGYSGEIVFYDDINLASSSKLLKSFEILRSIHEAREWFKVSNQFCIGVGNPRGRKILDEKLTAAGGVVVSVISPHAHVGKHDIILGEGVTVMTNAVLTGRLHIGRGVLVHIHCSVHHDVSVGDYCELSPGCRVLGGVTLGAMVSVGAGAVILPGLNIGEGAVIGAGAVVTKSVSAGATVVGVPAGIMSK